ncbi:MAG: carbohydrate kinase [Anaerolineae bacterium]|nr:carbohydrate kinase [Anaerolineae bacterium]
MKTSSKSYLLGIDQGSSGSRALVMNRNGDVCGYGYRALTRLYPQTGWAEQDPTAVVEGVTEAVMEAIVQAGCGPDDLIACGIAGQRNTDFVWDARTNRPLANAITWQDLRTMPIVTELEAWSLADQRRRRLGYFPGPYSSSMHLAWRMRHDPAVIDAARTGDLRIGFSAAWLLASAGKPTSHAMDYNLIQQLGLYDFRAERYWDEWLDRLNIAGEALPEAQPTLHNFGTLHCTGLDTSADVPVLAMIGNEQAALFGHRCHTPGAAECSHGTASFVDVFLGDTAPDQDKLNVYFAWHLGDRPTYCLEADTTVTGAALRWMKEEARLFDAYEEVGPLATSVPDSGGVVFVPAFTGLNVPYNDPLARGTILGLTLGSSRAHIVRAFLESLGYQMRSILQTIEAETGLCVEQLNVGGGIAASDEACQIQANLLGIPVVRPAFTEQAAQAAALLAGLGAGVWSSLDALPPMPGTFDTFDPTLSLDEREAGYAQWERAVERSRQWSL